MVGYMVGNDWLWLEMVGYDWKWLVVIVEIRLSFITADEVMVGYGWLRFLVVAQTVRG